VGEELVVGRVHEGERWWRRRRDEMMMVKGRVGRSL